MIVAGIMSGTSLDGIDVAIVEIRNRRMKPVAFRTFAYPNAVRAALLSVSNTMTHTAVISRLNFLLGELYAKALIQTCKRSRVPLKSIHLCGLHGQTIFHEGTPVEYLGHCIASTLQIGEAAVVAERTGIEVMSNFRERDIAAGGKGAPLVPFVDYLLFRHRTRARVALNIGGIANITAIPPAAKPEQIVAFDTGPGNMVIDALVSHMTKGRQVFDRNGQIARSGSVHKELYEAMIDDPFYKLKPPKTAGREQFGQQFVSGLLATGIRLPDLVATATELTAWSICRAILDATLHDNVEIIVSGGGLRNRYLMERIRYLLAPWKFVPSSEYGIDPDGKEAMAFAFLAYESWHGNPANLPSATGARRAVPLGKRTHGGSL